MYKAILILVMILGSAVDSRAQDTSWVYDPWSGKSNIYFDGKPEILDSNSEIFRIIRASVLLYCNSHYHFSIDTCVIHTEAYRWRKISFTDDATPSVVDKYKKEHIWYQLFFTLRIKPTITYELSYLLDSTGRKVEEAPMGIAAASRKQIWSIKEWGKLSHILKSYRKDYPVPVYKPKPELQYWAPTKSYVYYVISPCAKTKADMKKTSYEVCDKTMIIDAITGRVIMKKSKIGGMLVVQPQ